MWKFIKKLIGTIIIFNLSIFSFILVAFLAFSILADSSDTEIEENSVLRLKLNQKIIEQVQSEDPLQKVIDNTTEQFFRNFPIPIFDAAKTTSLQTIIKSIKNAKTDPKIKAIYLDLSSVQSGGAVMNEVIASLEDFKKEKPIWAFATDLSEGAYRVGCVADSLFMHPEGSIEFDGMSAVGTYYKNMMDKYKLKAYVFKVGDYKSAVEPFTRNSMSEENKQQLLELLTSYHNDYLQHIQKNRSIDMATLETITKEASLFNIESALQYGMIDKIAYSSEFKEALKKKVESGEKLNTISLSRYSKQDISDLDEILSSENKISVVVAEGEIGGVDGMNVSKIIKDLKKASEDKSVKAIILRINSPGGSYLLSDNIYRAVTLAKEKKPVISSMSNYAASGGYYIAMNCDTIVAQPNTITGSIGIFGLLLNIKKAAGEFGITYDGVKKGENADFVRRVMTDELTPYQENIIQKDLNTKYERFVAKVAAGRRLSVDSVKKIASGRVWIGRKAKEVGLVDIIGGFQTSVEVAAKMAGIGEDYQLKFNIPKQGFSLSSDNNAYSQPLLLRYMKSLDLLESNGALTHMKSELQKLISMQGVQARLMIPIEME